MQPPSTGKLNWLDDFCINLQDTLFDHLVFDTSQFLHHNVYETGNEAGQKANETTHYPTTDLQTAETLKVQQQKGMWAVRWKQMKPWEQVREGQHEFKRSKILGYNSEIQNRPALFTM